MSVSPTSMRNAGAPQPAGAVSEDQRATQRRDVMRATRAAREQQRGEFERALERARADEADEHDAPTPTPATVRVPEAVCVATPRPADEPVRRPDASRELDVRLPSFTGWHPGCDSPANHAPLVSPPRNTATPEDASRRLRDSQACADTHRWRFELADTTLPVQRLELQRHQGGTLQLALIPRESRHAAPAELALSRLQQRLAACGGEPAELQLQLHPSPTDDPLDDET